MLYSYANSFERLDTHDLIIWYIMQVLMYTMSTLGTLFVPNCRPE